MVNVGNYRTRPGVTVIPTGWEQHHKPTVDGSRTATVELWSGPADGESDYRFVDGAEVPNHGDQLTAQPVTARIQRLLSEDESVTGGQQITTRRYLVTLDRDTPSLTTRARVLVVQCDPELDGKYLHVQDVQGGSLRFERDLICFETV